MSADPENLLAHVLDRMDANCPMCGYALRGLVDPVCPECGEHLRIEVGLVEPKMAAFIAGVVGLASGIGFTAIVFAWGCVMMLRRSGGPDRPEMILLAFEIIVLGAVLAVWLWKRRWFRSRPATQRWTLALLTYVFTALLAGLFIAIVD